ncbi:MAG: hypothetical protein ACREEM_00620 [Blastocatellia bacterium]
MSRWNQHRTLIEVMGKLRSAASSIPLTLASQAAIRVVASVSSDRFRPAIKRANCKQTALT